MDADSVEKREYLARAMKCRRLWSPQKTSAMLVSRGAGNFRVVSRANRFELWGAGVKQVWFSRGSWFGGLFMKVPFLDLSLQHKAIREQALAALAATYDATRFCLGKDVDDFETNFSKTLGYPRTL